MMTSLLLQECFEDRLTSHISDEGTLSRSHEIESVAKKGDSFSKKVKSGGMLACSVNECAPLKRLYDSNEIELNSARNNAESCSHDSDSATSMKVDIEVDKVNSANRLACTVDVCAPRKRPNVDISKMVLRVNDKYRGSLYHQYSLIYDTAATVHLIRNLDLFESVPVPVEEDSVSFLGFDTEQGHEFAVSVGTLKYPLDGVTAYYAPKCVGNIISEPLFRQCFEVDDIRAADSRYDRMKSTRSGSSAVLEWSRGIEGVFITDLRQHIKCPETVLVSVREDVPICLNESDLTVETWLLELGLTAREVLVALALKRISASSIRDKVIDLCLEKAALNHIGKLSILDSYNKGVAIWDRENLPKYDTYSRVIEALRSVSIAHLGINDGINDKDKNGCISSCSTDSSLESGVSSNSDSVIISPPAGTYGWRAESGDEAKEASIANKVMMNMAALTDAEFVSHKEVSSAKFSVRVDGLKAGKEGRTTDSRRISTEAGGGTPDASDKLLALWIYQSDVNVTEILISKFINQIGLNSERKIVALSLAQIGLNKTRIKGIARVEELHKLTSFIGLETLRKMIGNGTVKHLDSNLTPLDVENYAKYVHETDCACIEGKMTTQPKPDFNNAIHSPHSCHCDVMQFTTRDKVTKFFFLIGVDAESQNILVSPLMDLKDASVKKGFMKFIDIYRRNPLKPQLTKIVLDGGGSLVSQNTKAVLDSVNLEHEVCTPGMHVVLAEAAIKIVKSLARTTVLDAGVKKKFLTIFVPYLVQWVVESINYSLRNGSDHASPHTRFTGEQVSMQVHFRAAFLDIVAVNSNATNPVNSDSRAKLGLVLARDESMRGALLLLDIETGHMMKRYFFKKLEGPAYILRVQEFLTSDKFLGVSTYEAEPIPDEVISLEGASGGASSVISAEKVDVLISADVEGASGGAPSVTFAEQVDVNIPAEPKVAPANATESSLKSALKGKAKSFKPITSAGISVKFESAFAVDTPDEGSCFFESISYFYKSNSGFSALELRDRTCDYILENSDELVNGISIQDTIVAIKPDPLLTDDQILLKYVHELRKVTTWSDSLEVIIMSKIIGAVILIFEKSKTKFTLRDTFGERIPGNKPKVITLLFSGSHYEPLNFTDAIIYNKIINTLSLQRLEGEVSDPNFVYSNRFDTFNEYRKSLTEVSSSSSKDPGNICDENLLDDRKSQFEMAFLTLASSPNPDLSPNLDLYPNPNLSPGESAGSKSLSDRRVQESDEAVFVELKQIHTKSVVNYSPELVEKVLSSSKGKKPIPIIVLKKEKFDSTGAFQKVKARGVCLGSQQELLAAYLKEAPTASIQSFYILIMIAAKFCIPLISKDVTGAFLNATLDLDETEVILWSSKHADIMCQIDPSLKDFRRKNGTLWGVLMKCLYGLQQSPRKWFATIRAILLSIGLKASEHDSCFFYLVHNGKRNYLLLFVDDMLIAFQCQVLYKLLCDKLLEAFGEVSEQSGDVISFLGITIRQQHDYITLDQEGFIQKMVDSLALDSIPVYKNPVATNFSICEDRFLRKQLEADPARLTQMRKLTMAVMYCAQRTRRDVLFITSFLASIMCPEKQDIDAIKRVIIYLHNTSGKKQYFYRVGPIKLILFGDASHNAFANATGQQCEIVYGDDTSAALDMSSVREKGVTQSSYESEMVVQNKLSDKGVKTYLMLTELSVPVALPMMMYSDNEAAVITANQEHINKMGRSKFMNRKLFYLHNLVVDGFVKPTWIATEENDADVGTKPLMGSHFDYLSNRQFSRLHYETDPVFTPKHSELVGAKVGGSSSKSTEKSHEDDVDKTAKKSSGGK